MAPTTVGIVAAAQAMTQEGLCETIKVSGLGLPEEMAPMSRADALRSSPCGASSISGTSPTTWHTG